MAEKHIIIIGGGFAGVNLAKHLGNKNGVKVTLVDRNNYNFFSTFIVSGFHGNVGYF